MSRAGRGWSEPDMLAPCQALVLEDDPIQAGVVTAAMREVYLDPVPAASPAQALRKLAYNHPVLAVVDLDMSLAPEPESMATVEDVLLRLYEAFGGCLVIVYSVRADEIGERKRIEGIHPLSMFVSKLDGERALLDRIRRLMGVRFGDLWVHKGTTVHEPTLRTFLHRVGVSLVVGASLGQEVVLDETDARAARRFNQWLIQVGSPVRVIDFGRRNYALHTDAAGSR